MKLEAAGSLVAIAMDHKKFSSAATTKLIIKETDQ